MKKKLDLYDWMLCLGLFYKKYWNRHNDYHEFHKIDEEKLTAVAYDIAKNDPYFRDKPVLRTIEELTKEELEEFENLFGVKIKTICGFKIHHYDWLTKKGIDVRGWIEAGLAVPYKEFKQRMDQDYVMDAIIYNNQFESFDFCKICIFKKECNQSVLIDNFEENKCSISLCSYFQNEEDF